MTEDKFCPKCRHELGFKEIHGTVRPVCSYCYHVMFYGPKLVATVIVESEGRILMVKRSIEPGCGLWCFPGGYLQTGEIVEQGAIREVFEETGLHIEIDGFIGLFSEENHPVVLAVYYGSILGGQLEAGLEVSEVGLFMPDELPELAFPKDIEFLRTWMHSRKSDKR
tara:strand:+ start:140 stop:640 length:501 start_codon:yes stop_codon:yes gene_type:complete